MTDMNSFQVVLRIHAEDDVVEGELEATAEAVLERVMAEAAFVALGPVMCVDFTENAVEVEFTVATESADQMHQKVRRVSEVVLAAANDFEFQGSTTSRLAPALA